MGGYGAALVNGGTSAVANFGLGGSLAYAVGEHMQVKAAKKEAAKARLATAKSSWRERAMLYIRTEW